jgi:hypothetical protein
MYLSSYRSAFIKSIILVAAMSLFLSCGRTQEQKDIWGVWSGSSQGEQLAFEFRPDGKCLLTFVNEASGDTNTLHGRYKLDFTKQPVPISIRGIKEIPDALHAIVDFQNDGTIRFSQFSTRWRLRPVSFESDKTLILRRAVAKQ